jgi:hypothetical protein
MTTSEGNQSTGEVVEAGRAEGMTQTRELQVTREIATAFLTATRPVEVYRLALARVTPIVQASFSSIFLRDPSDPSLLRLECAQSWPHSA